MLIELSRVLRNKSENRITNKTLRTEEIDRRILRGYVLKSQNLRRAAYAAVGDAPEKLKIKKAKDTRRNGRSIAFIQPDLEFSPCTRRGARPCGEANTWLGIWRCYEFP
ncbi:MAG: hypothetical protein LUO89_09020 [Methanothrix sp.]|nr:hypothetical protein [Methanothrix sp.]